MVQQDLLTQLHRAWQRFFAREGGMPRFKRKLRGDWAPLGIAARECKGISRKLVRLPKLGDLRVRGHRALVGDPVRVSLIREVDQWFVSITCEVTEAKPREPSGEAVGLDFGVANVLADSNDQLVANPRHLARAQQRLTRAQRTAARRKPRRGQPASNNYRKATRKVALRHRKVRRQRQHMQHVLTHHYANSHGTVVIEDLRVRAMSSSAKGTQQTPGTRVQQKAGLNKAILDVGWYALRRQLAYKCARSGAELVVVDPRVQLAAVPTVRCDRQALAPNAGALRMRRVRLSCARGCECGSEHPCPRCRARRGNAGASLRRPHHGAAVEAERGPRERPRKTSPVL